jgi:UDP-glucose 4-epimerase
MRILVTGGAGYIGSHVVLALAEQGHDITIIDNLSSGHKKAVSTGELIILDLADKVRVDEVFAIKKFEAVLHFAGSIVVPESVSKPLEYYQNNTLNSHFLISQCLKHKVPRFIFSSTAAVYGDTDGGASAENSVVAPLNPYGFSKLMTEQMLKDAAIANPDFKFVALRYFNVSGADPKGRVGQSFPGATHLIKAACETACGKRTELKVFGTDYPTKDGTCVRDYIHVSDLAAAHLAALNYLVQGGESDIMNCGYGHGFSVKEVITLVKKVSGVDFKVIESPRRPGDAATTISNVSLIHKKMDWTPKHDNLEFIIKTAYDWEIKRPY